jgi:hypothetical protein
MRRSTNVILAEKSLDSLLQAGDEAAELVNSGQVAPTFWRLQ